MGISNPQTGPRPVLVHHSISGTFAIRMGPWKFVEARGSNGFSVPKTVKAKEGEPTTQLYNLAADPKETKNLAAVEAERTASLATRLEAIKNSKRLSDVPLD